MASCAADSGAESHDDSTQELAEEGQYPASYEPYGEIGNYYWFWGGPDYYGIPISPERDVDTHTGNCKDAGHQARRYQEFSKQMVLCWSPEEGVWQQSGFRGIAVLRPSGGRPPAQIGEINPPTVVPPKKPESKSFWWNVGCYCTGSSYPIGNSYLVAAIAAGHVCVDETDKNVDPTTRGDSYCSLICGEYFSGISISQANACGVFAKTDRHCELVGDTAKFYLGSAASCQEIKFEPPKTEADPKPEKL